MIDVSLAGPSQFGLGIFYTEGVKEDMSTGSTEDVNLLSICFILFDINIIW